MQTTRVPYPKTLTRCTSQFQGNRRIRHTLVAITFRNLTRQTCADRTVTVSNIKRKTHRLLFLQPRLSPYPTFLMPRGLYRGGLKGVTQYCALSAGIASFFKIGDRSKLRCLSVSPGKMVNRSVRPIKSADLPHPTSPTISVYLQP